MEAPNCHHMTFQWAQTMECVSQREGCSSIRSTAPAAASANAAPPASKASSYTPPWQSTRSPWRPPSCGPNRCWGPRQVRGCVAGPATAAAATRMPLPASARFAPNWWGPQPDTASNPRDQGNPQPPSTGPHRCQCPRWGRGCAAGRAPASAAPCLWQPAPKPRSEPAAMHPGAAAQGRQARASAAAQAARTSPCTAPGRQCFRERGNAR